ncbi:MAG TPA: CBS domain-containing protein [Noviherbaspirillum sp.]|nr:CBS domain-containing protein [Noviherbaspirillum sp.]
MALNAVREGALFPLQEDSMASRISEVMTRDVTLISPTDTIQHAAKMMADWNVGVLPVCEGKALKGVLTDRDIAVRAVPSGKPPADIEVHDVMSTNIFWCFDDQSVGEALQQMGDMQIRRIPVVNHSMEIVGIVSLGDLATRHKADVEDALEKISTPSEPARQGANRGEPQSDEPRHS